MGKLETLGQCPEAAQPVRVDPKTVNPRPVRPAQALSTVRCLFSRSMILKSPFLTLLISNKRSAPALQTGSSLSASQQPQGPSWSLL